MILRHVGRRWWWRILITYNLVLLGQNTFGLIIAKSISKRSPFQVWHVFKPFCYGCITNCMFTFHTYSNYIMGWKYIVHVYAKFYMVGLHQMPHSNQDTQANMKPYHKAMKCWFSFKTKGLRGHHIGWLVWRLTTTMAWPSQHEEASVHKKQGHGATYSGKCWQS
jgi:hypothetical protein